MFALRCAVPSRSRLSSTTRGLDRASDLAQERCDLATRYVVGERVETILHAGCNFRGAVRRGGFG